MPPPLEINETLGEFTAANPPQHASASMLPEAMRLKELPATAATLVSLRRFTWPGVVLFRKMLPLPVVVAGADTRRLICPPAPVLVITRLFARPAAPMLPELAVSVMFGLSSEPPGACRMLVCAVIVMALETPPLAVTCPATWMPPPVMPLTVVSWKSPSPLMVPSASDEFNLTASTLLDGSRSTSARKTLPRPASVDVALADSDSCVVPLAPLLTTSALVTVLDPTIDVPGAPMLPAVDTRLIVGLAIAMLPGTNWLMLEVAVRLKDAAEVSGCDAVFRSTRSSCAVLLMKTLPNPMPVPGAVAKRVSVDDALTLTAPLNAPLPILPVVAVKLMAGAVRLPLPSEISRMLVCAVRFIDEVAVVGPATRMPPLLVVTWKMPPPVPPLAVVPSN